MQIIGVIVGIVSGIIWELLATSPYKGAPTLFPSILVNNTSKVLHIHHWVIYFGIALVVLVWSIKSQKVFHPAILMVLSFLLAAIMYNFYKYADWYKFFK